MIQDRDIAKAMFEAFGFKVIDVEHPYAADAARLRPMTDDAVKRLWEAYDGMNSPLGISGEAIHMELNGRGPGEYCAV